MRCRAALLVAGLVALYATPSASGAVLTATKNGAFYQYTLAMGSAVSTVTVDEDPASSKFRIRESGDALTLNGNPDNVCTGLMTGGYACTVSVSALSITNSGGSTTPPTRDQVIVAGPAHGDPTDTWSPIGISLGNMGGLIEVWFGDKESFASTLSNIATGTPAEPADIVHAQGGNVFCIASCMLGAGADRWEGTSRYDNVLGGDGDDVILGGAGDDNLSGDGGDDVIQGGLGADMVYGKAGQDTLSFDDPERTNGLNVTFTALTAATIGDPTDDAKGGGGTPGDQVEATFERIVGTRLADTIIGGVGDEEVTGGPGFDTLGGGAGTDVIHAQDGFEDTIDCGDGADTVERDEVDGLTGCETTFTTPGGQLKNPPPPPDPPATGTFAPSNNPFPQAGGPPPGTTSGQLARLVLAARISATFAAGRAGTKVTRLSVAKVVAGTTIVVTCKARRRLSCPFATKTVKVKKAGAVTLTSLFKKRRLPVGTVVKVTVSEPRSVGVSAAFTVRKAKKPTRKNGCVGGTGAATAC